MPAFFATNSGGARIVLDDTETDVVRRLLEEFRELLSGDVDRRDPVHARLFPATYEDASDERAFRELVGGDLLTHKLNAIDAVANALGAGSDVTLDGDMLELWLACLTDLRLAIGTRIEVDEDRMSEDIDPNDPDAQSLAVLHWLGWIQEGLLRAATG